MSGVRLVNYPLRGAEKHYSWEAELRLTFHASDEEDARVELEKLCNKLMSDSPVWRIGGGLLGEHHQNEGLREALR